MAGRVSDTRTETSMPRQSAAAPVQLPDRGTAMPGSRTTATRMSLAGADDAVGGVELDPAGTGQVHLQPGMGVAAAMPLRVAGMGAGRHVEVAGHEPGGQPKGAHRLHHQHRVIPAGAGFQAQGGARVLDAGLVPRLVGEAVADRLGHPDQHVDGLGAAVLVQELVCPAINHMPGIGQLPLHGPQQVRHLLRVIAERELPGIVGDHRGHGRCLDVLHLQHAVEHQRVVTLAEPRPGDRVAEHVHRPMQRCRRRVDGQHVRHQALVMAVARPEHHAVFPEGERVSVSVGRDVSNGQQGQGSPRGGW